MKSLRHYHRKWRIWRNKIQLFKKMTPLMLAVFINKNVNGQDTLNNAAFIKNKNAFNPEIVNTKIDDIFVKIKLVDFDNDGDLDIIGRGKRDEMYEYNLDISLFYIENRGTKNLPYFEVKVNEIGYGFENNSPIFLNSNLEKIKEIRSFKTNNNQSVEENQWNEENASFNYSFDFIFKDFNGDEKFDLITMNSLYYASDSYEFKVSFYENIGSANAPIFDTIPSIVKSNIIPTDSLHANFLNNLYVADIDEDGTIEIIAGFDYEAIYDIEYGNYLKIKLVFIENNGTKTGDFIEIGKIDFQGRPVIRPLPNFITFNDINQDNKIDVGVYLTEKISYRRFASYKSLINKNGNFEPNPLYNSTFYELKSYASYEGSIILSNDFIDLDNDGDVDILMLHETGLYYCGAQCYYNPHFTFYENNGKIGVASGNILFDLDNDGITTENEQNTAENLRLRPKIIHGNYVQLANPNYYIFLDIGTNTITPSLENFTFSPENHTINFDGNVNVNIDTLNFIATFDTSKIDFSIDIANAGGAFRPGFPAYQNIAISGFDYFNKTGIITYHLNENLLLLNSEPPFTSTADGKYFWQMDSIGNRKNSILLSLQVKASTPIGTNINSYCQIEILDFEEKNLVNNVDSTNIRTTGSYDPNDKICNLDPTVEPSEKPFEYTIRFQNTGNDTAFNIVVIDTINTNFDISTFEMIQSSHPYKVEFDKNRTAKFYFYNILLPPSSTNEPASHGFIKYSIQPKQGAGIGTTFTNKADIYFDFNTPITTNETRNIFGVISGINDHQHQQNIASIAYPNPTREKLLIEFNNPEKQATIITIYDINGKQLLQKTIEDNFFSFNTEAFSNGVYLYTIESIVGFGKGKFIKE
ncbi:MAG: T9SS type A sorting domain-containing protein [Chitinophagales bacterium]|nr:T9SS type A sorting domain-containing protein [Chitinophagales bacterium]